MAFSARPVFPLASLAEDWKLPLLWSGSSLSVERQRGLALAAWYAVSWSAYQDVLPLVPGRPERDTTPREEAIDALRDWWGVMSESEVCGQIQALQHGGHATAYELVGPLVQDAIDHTDGTGLNAREDAHRRMLRELSYFRGEEPIGYQRAYDAWLQARKLGVDGELPTPTATDVAAWDFARAVFLVRAGHTAGYLGEDEAWVLIDATLDLTREHYGNWRQFAAAFLWGAAFWKAGHDLSGVIDDARERRGAALALSEHPDGAWRRFSLHP